jgi:hypothetical protein
MAKTQAEKASEAKLLAAAIPYINSNAAELHGDKKFDLPKITAKDVEGFSVDNLRGHIMVLVNRGIKGMPKYTIPLAELEKARIAPKAAKK